MLPQEIKTRLTQLKGKQFKYDGQVYQVKGVNVDKDSGKFTITTDRNTFTRKLSVAPVFFESIKLMNGSLPKAEKTNGLKKSEPVPAAPLEHQPSSVIVYSTTDYSRFRMVDGNRGINMRKVNKIIKEIEAGNDMLEYYPIQIEENGERLDIFDGQHRFIIDQKLKRPVYYILVKEKKSIPDIASVNSNVEKWNSLNFINSYLQHGNDHYRELQDFIKLFPVAISTAIRLLHKGEPGVEGANPQMMDDFRAGKFTCLHKKEAYELASECKKYESFESWHDRGFMIAIYRIKRAGLVPLEDLLSAFQKRPEMLTKQGSYKQYIWNLEQIVNVNKQKRIVIV